MTPNPQIMKSVEKLNYRVTVGDVAASAGLEINQAQQGLIALASVAGGNLQVSDTGEIVYLFPKNFRSILENKYWKLRLQQSWQKIWRVLFYLIRISFGVILIASIALMLIAIAIILIAISSSRDDNDDSGGMIFAPNFWISPDIFWFFDPGYEQQRRQRQHSDPPQNEMNFLEAIFSFLFGDGDPNADLEERRWQTIGSVIRNHQGAVIAQQIAPYLDDIDRVSDENEDYILPTLTRFNGYPEVSPAGEIIYYFPDLQVTANQNHKQSLSDYLKQQLWRFSNASSGQITMAIGLGSVNFILALVLGSLLRGGVAAQLGGLVGFVAGIYGVLLVYGIGFLAIPLIRYFWIQNRNSKIASINQQRQQRAKLLSQNNPTLLQKIAYARQFASQKVISDRDITYSTETDLIDQEINNADKIDEEWQRRLRSDH